FYPRITAESGSVLDARQQMKCFPLGFALINRGYVFDGVPPQMLMDDFGHLGDDDEAELPIALIGYPPTQLP
ncbi:hypothetical protein, partial [Stenotrophomonas forensis]|uniref:hypothetical protein n=1 Tax=Stenotrophomonas forensis TaxID=2871169 RepID=UPI0039C7485C